MVSTRRMAALAQVPTPAAACPANLKILAAGRRGNGNDNFEESSTDLEEQEEEDYVDDTAMLSDSASGDSGSDWETKSTLSDSTLHTILDTQ